MSTHDTVIQKAARRFGILAGYEDFSGAWHNTSEDTILRMFAAMGLPSTTGDLSNYLAFDSAGNNKRRLADEIIITANEACQIRLRGDKRCTWSCRGENGEIYEGTATETIALPPLPPGYYELNIDGRDTFLIAAARKAPSLQDATGRQKVWGVFCNLYGLRSARNFGIGDFRDLANLANTLESRGADFIGINPLHALGHASDHYSPYAPSHRSFLNTAHIATDWPLEYQASDEAQRHAERIEQKLHAHRCANLIDYAAVRSIQEPALRAMFSTLMQSDQLSERRKQFDQFRRHGGEELHRFCVFESLSTVYGPTWQQWPEPMQRPDSLDVTHFANERASDVRYHAYLQWLAAEQATMAANACRDQAMAIGLYADFAVGVRPDGAEVWADQESFAHGVSLGAPPDQFSPTGQCWNVAPLNPITLSRHRYRRFIAAVRVQLHFAKMLRIDHAIGLLRSYWIPESGGEGAYVRYPLKSLLAILRVEAHRANAIIIGEDLGLVPDGLRAELTQSGLYGCYVTQFERDEKGALQSPVTYRSDSLASFGTHDTPTLRGYVTGTDICERLQIGQLNQTEAVELQQQRLSDVRELAKMVGLGPSAFRCDEPSTGILVETMTLTDLKNRLHAQIVDGSAEIAMLALDDILDVLSQANTPGTIHELPNWRRRYDVSIEDMEHDPRLDVKTECLPPKHG